jgi:ERCC4-type nuclease
MRHKEEMPQIVVDTREQIPYTFANAVRAGLPTGDYSLVGYEDMVAVERKSVIDALGSLGAGRARFRREVVRLAKLPYGTIVVEATIEEFLRGDPRSAMNPKSALHSLLGWSVELGVPVWFPGPRNVARGLVYHLLRHFWRTRLATLTTHHHRSGSC